MLKFKPLYSHFNRINYALCKFEIIRNNEGNKVIEDWRVTFEFEKDNFVRLTDTAAGPLGIVDVSSIVHKRTYCKDNRIVFRPNNNKPLVQKDNTYFEAWIEPLAQEYEFKILWNLIARDFNEQGELKMIVRPKYENEYIDVEVETEAELKPDEIIEIKAKKNYREEENE